MRVTIDEQVCQGHALCAAAGPRVYDLDDNGHCVPFMEIVPPDLETEAKEGAEVCPERAITLSD